MTPALCHGQGPLKALVLNGWLGCASHWQAMMEAVDPARCTLALFDYRGYGSRRDVPGRYDFQEAAGDVLALADAMGWDRFALVGHSMGGMAMQRVAVAAPTRITGMLGIAPVSAAGSGLAGERLALFERAVQDEEARQRIVDFSTGSRLSAWWCASVADEAGRAHRPEAMLAYLHQWGLDDFSAQASALRLPVRLLVGEHDPTINAESVGRNWLLHHPQARVELVRNAGHYPMQEAPLAVGSAVQRWLQEIAAAAAQP